MCEVLAVPHAFPFLPGLWGTNRLRLAAKQSVGHKHRAYGHNKPKLTRNHAPDGTRP